jgi:hypothetical protein
VTPLLRSVLLAGVLAVAPPACWLTSSFDGLSGSDSGVVKPDASNDGPAGDVSPDAPRDGLPPPNDSGADGMKDGSLDAPDVTCVTASTYVESVMAANPIAYWPLDEDGGPLAFDYADGGYNGNYSSMGVTYGQPGVLDGGTSVLFDGTHGDILVTDGMFGSVADFLGSASFSLEAWIMPTALTPEYRGIITNETQDDAGKKQGYAVYLESDAGFGFDRYQNGKSTPLRVSGAVLAGSWSHVVMTMGEDDDGGYTMKIYVNGMERTSISTDILIQNGCKFAIGSTICGTQGFFEGNFDEVAVYGHALDEECIMRHYNLANSK